MYRLLEANEEIKEDDEYYQFVLGWKKCEGLDGSILGSDNCMPVRRKISTIKSDNICDYCKTGNCDDCDNPVAFEGLKLYIIK